jgi:hypothetical protein
MARDRTGSEGKRADGSVVADGAHRLRARSANVGNQARPFSQRWKRRVGTEGAQEAGNRSYSSKHR